jgi:hypothetical protein
MPGSAQTAIERALAAACVVLLLWSATLIIRPAPALFGYPLSEDGYYALSVARHLGAGDGLTTDGVHKTTGVQPLWVLLLAPVAALARGDRTAIVRAAVALHWLFYAAAAAAIALFAGRLAKAAGLPSRATGLVAAFLYLSNTTLRDLHFNALETGLVLALYAVTATLVARMNWRKPSTAVVAGLMCGVLALARVDTVFFAMLLVPCAVRMRDAGGIRQWLRAAVTVPAIAAVCVAPWLAIAFMQSGRLMPSGGAAQAGGFSIGRVYVAALYGAASLVPLPFDSFQVERYAPAAAIVLVLFGLAAVLIRRWRHAVVELLETREFRVVLLLAVNAAVLMLWYGATSRAWWMYSRYAAPAALAGIPAIAVAFVFVTGSRFRLAAGALIAGSFVCAILARPALSARADARRPHLTLLDVAEREVPPGALVGALQSGTLGFFRDHVVNLDGKVNEDALARKDDLPGYCRDEKIEWIVDWPFLLDRDFFKGRPREPWRLIKESRVEGCENCTFAVYTARPLQP